MSVYAPWRQNERTISFNELVEKHPSSVGLTAQNSINLVSGVSLAVSGVVNLVEIIPFDCTLTFTAVRMFDLARIFKYAYSLKVGVNHTKDFAVVESNPCGIFAWVTLCP